MRIPGRVLAAAAAVGTTLAAAPVARADSLSLATDPAQPRDNAPVQIVASGSTDSTSATISVHYRPAGTGGCAGSPDVDSGSSISPDGTGVATGQPFSVTGTPQQLPVGSYLVCGWLLDNNNNGAVTYQFSLQVTVSPADSLFLTAPGDAVAGQAVDVTASGNAYDGSAVVDATLKPASASCAGSPPPADNGTPTGASGVPVGGQVPYSASVISQQTFDAGSYLVCAWLVDSNSTQVLAATQVVLKVAPLQAAIRISAPTQVDPSQSIAVGLVADLQAGIPVTASIDYKPAVAGTTCAARPSGEPTSSTNVLDQSITDTQQPSGEVTASTNGSLPTPGRYLFCGWLLEGWTNSTNPPVVTGPVSAVITVLAPVVYRGRTSQRRQISISLAAVEHLVISIVYADHLRCQGPAILSTGIPWNGNWSGSFDTTTLGTLHVGGSGHFGVRLDGNPAHTFDLKGTQKGKQITGSFTERGRAFAFTSNNAERSRCTSGRVRYSVRTK